MAISFFEKPILNSPYVYPDRHWELDDSGQPTNKIVENRRTAKFITPIPKPRQRRQTHEQQEIVFNEGLGLSTAAQQYEATSSNINRLRQLVDRWREIPSPSDWRTSPEARRRWRPPGSTPLAKRRAGRSGRTTFKTETPVPAWP